MIKQKTEISKIKDIIEDFKEGKLVILVDDKERENEGDIIVSAEKITKEQMAFIIRYTSGIVCLPMSNKIADDFGLPPMVQNNSSKLNTPFTISIEAKDGITTGVSASDRVTTIRKVCADNARRDDIVSPGHIFPLRASDGGVLKRAGHTEASIDIARLSGLKKIAVLSELMNDDGSMMKLEQILNFAYKNNIKVGTIEDLIAYRIEYDGFLTKEAESKLPTEFGEFSIHVFYDHLSKTEHFALTMGDLSSNEPILLRVHSECLTGDNFASIRCDCGAQRDAAMNAIANEGRGIFLYLRQEGRGIGITNKIKAYELQDQGYDTVEANNKLGFPADLREYGVGAQIVRYLGARKIKVLTNNPKKLVGLEGYNIKIVDRIPLDVGSNKFNESYKRTKGEKLGHFGL